MTNRKNIKITPWAVLISALLLIGCTPDEESTAKSLKPLPLSIASVNTNANNDLGTRGGPTPINDGSIGVFNIADPTANISASSILKYTGINGSWMPDNGSLSIASTTQIGAYYPYVAGYADPTKIPFDTSLYTEAFYNQALTYYESPGPATVVNGKYQKSFNLKPIHAVIKFTLSGIATANQENKATEFSVYQANLPGNWHINITGATLVYTINSKKPLLTMPTNALLSNNPTMYLLLPPCTLYDASNTNMSVTVTVDGIPRLTNINLKANGIDGQLQAGHIYPIKLNFAPTQPTIEPEANCYLVETNKTIYIPVSQAEKGNPERFKLAQQNYSYEMLWWDGYGNGVDVIDLSGSQNRYIKVKTGVSEGNASICLRNKSTSEILWSWHIWVTSYNPEFYSMNGKIYTSDFNQLTFMDRNLGTVTAAYGSVPISTCGGLMYQWGRKDPYPGGENANSLKTLYNYVQPNNTEGANLTPVSPSKQLKFANANASPLTPENVTAYSINNPQVIIYSWQGSMGSTVTNKIDSWGATSGKKTIYDPCPAGWRVPGFVGGFSPWDGYNKVSQIATGEMGCTEVKNNTNNSLGVYPYAGYYMPTSQLTHFGISEMLWSSQCQELGSGYYTSFNTTVDKGYLNAHYLISVRCVKEY